MVFRDPLEQLTRKLEGAVYDSPDIGLSDTAIRKLSTSFELGLQVFQKNQHQLAHILLSGNDDSKDHILFSGKDESKDFRDVLLDMRMITFCCEQIGLKEKKTNVAVRSGEGQGGQAPDDSLIPGLHDDTAMDILAWSCRSDYPNLACVNKKFKALIGSGYLYKVRRQLGIREHWVYLACILMPWEAFDPARQRWMRLPQIPCDECFTYADKESLAVGTELLVFGRELFGFAIWKYSLLTHNWSRCPLMNLPRCLFGTSSLGEIAIVAGGSDNNGQILKSAELFNSELGKWRTLPDMNLPRKLCSGFFMDGKFYVIGGMSSQTDCLSCGEEYDLETRTWRRIENMYPISSVGHPAMRSPPLVAVVNNQLYSADQVTNEVKKYDKTNNSWSVVKRLPVRADSSNGWGLAFKPCGENLLVIGGHRGWEGEVIVLHSWDPQDRSMDGAEWNVLAVKERAGAFVYNCAVMGC